MESSDFASTSWWLQSKILATCIAGFLALVVLWNKFGSSKRPRLPPGPVGWPLLGHLPTIGRRPYLSLMKMSKKYGPLMTVRFGLFPAVVVSSPEMVKVILRTQDHVFATRAPSLTGEVFSYDYKGIAFAPYNANWRLLRKLIESEVLSQRRLKQLKNVRCEETFAAIERMLKTGREGGVVNLTHTMLQLTFDHICRVLFGKRYFGRSSVDGERSLHSLMDEWASIVGSFIVGEYIPFFKKLDLGGYEAAFSRLRLATEKFLNPIIEEHRNKPEQDDDSKDFMDVMISLQRENAGDGFPDDQIKAVLQDMLIGGMETSRDTVIWLLAELLRHPDMMQKMVEELDLVVGKDRLVEESDLGSLKHLKAATKETLRMYPAAPLAAPHVAMKDTQIDGYDIPKDTRVVMNIYGIGRDPNVWEDPNTFKPFERFLDKPIDMRGQHWELTPFGSGRRGCPGMDMGILIVELVVAQVLHTCVLSLPPGVEVDVEEGIGITLPKANPIHVFASPRLRPEVYHQYGINL